MLVLTLLLDLNFRDWVYVRSVIYSPEDRLELGWCGAFGRALIEFDLSLWILVQYEMQVKVDDKILC